MNLFFNFYFTVKHLPDWLPGAGFKKTAARWKRTLDELTEKPYAFTKQQMVRERFFILRPPPPLWRHRATPTGSEIPSPRPAAITFEVSAWLSCAGSAVHTHTVRFLLPAPPGELGSGARALEKCSATSTCPREIAVPPAVLDGQAPSVAIRRWAAGCHSVVTILMNVPAFCRLLRGTRTRRPWVYAYAVLIRMQSERAQLLALRRALSSFPSRRP